MNLKLTNKTALITGSTSGIGYATAKLLAQEGVEVILNGRKQVSLEKAVKKLQEEIPEAKIKGIAADFEVAEEVDGLIKMLGDIDILINNVGIYSSKSFYETTDEDWFRHFEVNVMSGVRLSRAILPKMLERNWGRIIFISSECATLVPDDLIAYSMTKTALLSVSRGLAQLCKGSEVTVNSVLPGSTLTEGAESFLEALAEKEGTTVQQAEADFFTNIRTSSLLARFAKVEEVASTIAYLCSPLAVATNGASIKVDGGSTGGII
ncbi:MAG: SDR family NAD(P)-dependent oxidoreductase [Bacteroidota bacterium]